MGIHLYKVISASPYNPCQTHSLGHIPNNVASRCCMVTKSIDSKIMEYSIESGIDGIKGCRIQIVESLLDMLTIILW